MLTTPQGILHVPNRVVIPGQASFAGRSFHSAEWPADFDATGKVHILFFSQFACWNGFFLFRCHWQGIHTFDLFCVLLLARIVLLIFSCLVFLYVVVAAAVVACLCFSC
jgi:hypothetical protein